MNELLLRTDRVQQRIDAIALDHARLLERKIVLEADIDKLVKASHLARLCLDEQADGRAFIEGVVNAFVTPYYGVDFSFERIQDGDDILKGVAPQIVEDGQVVPVRRNGGGLRNMISLAIRFAQIAFLVRRYGIEPLLVLDEQLGNLDDEAFPYVVDVWKSMIEQGVNIQGIFVLHKNVEFPATLEVFESGTKISKTRLIKTS